VQYDKLRAIGLEGAFQCVLLSEEVGVRKPDPRIFHQACAALGAEPGKVVYVGDSYRNDVVGARNAGLLSCWYNPGGAAPEDPQVRPDFHIRRLDQLPGVLGLRD
ncbi:MAG: HAD family hydrolase, partial [Gemmatimonadota bacterium]